MTRSLRDGLISLMKMWHPDASQSNEQVFELPGGHVGPQMNPCFCSSHYDGVISVWPLPWQVPLLLHRAAFIAGVRVIRNDLFWTHRSAFVELPPTDSHSRSESTQRRPDSRSTSKLYNSWETCGQFWEVVFIAPMGYFGDPEILEVWE